MRFSFSRKESRHRRAFALVVVLGVLALLVILAVGFIGRATTERAAASGYHSAAHARLLADTVVGLIQGQIHAASTQGYDVVWASQPGMIRTFDASGDLLHAYKLYSADNMISDSVDISADVPTDGSWAQKPALWTDLNAPVAGVYPILYPTSNAEGFSLTGAPRAGASGNAAPMPVRWLYVLSDGTLVCPPDGSGAEVPISGASDQNPIVGRVAFWTDDETAKVNINTASEGVYWDVPRYNTQDDRNLGQYQPAQKEFQRYSGHPAMTSLSAVFPTLSQDQIYSIVPRISGGGSRGGTAIADSKISPDTDRLYASIDEMVFNSDFNGERGRNSGLTKSQLEHAKFFLTAHSRGPEVNLFNLPRIACWPIHEDISASSQKVTTFDRLIAFCSTINGNPYYFQRKNADSPTADISISRNLELYRYLQYLTAEPIPGFGGNFLAKYGDDRDQILTQIFDYIRSTNLYDDTLSAGQQFTDGYTGTRADTGHGSVVPTTKDDTRGFGRFLTLSEFAIGFICTAEADDPATEQDESYGSNVEENGVWPARNPSKLPVGSKRIQAIIVPEFFSPMVGYGILKPDFRIVIRGLNTFTYNGVNLGFPADGVLDYAHEPAEMYGAPSVGGTLTYRYFGYGREKSYPFVSQPIEIPSNLTSAPFTGGDVTVEFRTRDTDTLLQTLKLTFPNGTFPVPQLDTEGSEGGTGYPAKSARAWWSFLDNGLTGSDKGGRLAFIHEYVRNFDKLSNGAFFRGKFDVVRSIVPRHGDYRLVAAREVLDDTAAANPTFIAHPQYNDTNKNIACYLSSCWVHFSGATTNVSDNIWQDTTPEPKYFSSVVMPKYLVPDIHGEAITRNETPETTGDFDNGVPQIVDGPYINKPDEGNIYRRDASAIPYFTGIDQRWPPGQTFFSPNRQMPSPGMFGSLPSRVKADTPWATLLFRPQDGHPGAASPRDHLLLDLFWMPVVEPYAISDPFSTAGKINMNFQILPFTYISRPTGLYALLKAEKVAAVPNAMANRYKFVHAIAPFNARLSINIEQTLKQFTDRFNSGKIFLSASEICDLHIVPQGSTLESMATFWSSNRLTGENVRERIYTMLYPRITTKSNTYTVHFRTQALKKVPGTQAGVWVEGTDRVMGEYRGSTTIERFLPTPLPSNYRDYAANVSSIPSLPTLDTFYKWRIIENKQFAP